MRKRKITICAIIFWVCLGMMSALWCPKAEAAPKAATASNGKYVYYHNTKRIYRLDTNTGKNKVIAKRNTLGALDSFNDIVYCRKYLYGEGGHEGAPYIFRMKVKGGKVKRLAWGYNPVVYNNKIYYIGSSGVARMSLNGKNKKKIVKGSGGNVESFQIVNNRIYYCVSYDFEDCYLYSASLSGTDVREISSEIFYDSDNPSLQRLLYSDGRDIYYATEDSVHRIAGKTGEDKELPNLPWVAASWNYGGMQIRDIYNGVIYFADSRSGCKLKKYTVSNGKTVTMKSFKKNSGFNIWVGKGKYAALNIYTPAGKEVVARIKTNGKGYKVLAK